MSKLPEGFSIARAIVGATRGGSPESEWSDFVASDHADTINQLGGIRPTGRYSFWLPLERAGITGSIDTTTASTGGPFKFTQSGGFLDLLRQRTAVMRAGSTVITGLKGPVSFPKALTAGTATWVAENPASDVTRSAFTTGSVSLAFKTVQAASAVSRQALFSAAGGNLDLEQIIRNDLAQVVSLAIDLAATNGLGSSNQPLGLLQHTGITTVAAGTDGAVFSGAMAAELEYNIANGNADVGSLGFVTTPNVRQKGRVTDEYSGAAAPVWARDNTVIGYPAYATKQVPSNLTKGTSTTVCSALIFGAWQDMLVGFFGPGVEITVDPYALKLQNLIDINVTAYLDVAVARTDSFNVMKDLTTA